MFGLRWDHIYNVIGSNCQDFCNYILERMNAEWHMTTVEKAAVGSSGILAFALFAVMRGIQ